MDDHRIGRLDQEITHLIWLISSVLGYFGPLILKPAEQIWEDGILIYLFKSFVWLPILKLNCGQPYKLTHNTASSLESYSSILVVLLCDCAEKQVQQSILKI